MSFKLCSYTETGSNRTLDVFKSRSDILCLTHQKIYKGIAKSSDQPNKTVAIKEANISSSKSKGEDLQIAVETELKAFQKIRHTNLVAIYASTCKPCLNGDLTVNIVMECCPEGDMASYLSKNTMSENKIQSFFKQIVRGLRELNQNDLAHMRLKPRNVLIDKNTVKLVDFGLKCIESPYYEISGFMAPELLETPKAEVNLYKSDVFSLGVLLYYFYYKKTPWTIGEQWNKTHLLNHYRERIRMQDQIFDDRVNVSAEAKDLIQKMLCLDPKNRISLSQIRKHDYYTKVIEYGQEVIGKISKKIQEKLRKAEFLQESLQTIYEANIFIPSKNVWLTCLLKISKKISEKLTKLNDLLMMQDIRWFQQEEWDIFFKSESYETLKQQVQESTKTAQINYCNLRQKTEVLRKKNQFEAVEEDLSTIVQKMIRIHEKTNESEKDQNREKNRKLGKMLKELEMLLQKAKKVL